MPNLPEAEVVIELGRYIVGECGVYVTRVVDRKVSRGRTYLVVNGGVHLQLAASGTFGQVIRRNYPIAVGIQDRADRLEGSTELFGSLPELDSIALVTLAVNLEREFDFEIDERLHRGGLRHYRHPG